jgi:carbon storage regulator
MLVLSRKKGQRIVIGDNIEVTIIEVRGDRVKLGFAGPPDVAIHREEVYRRIEAESAAWQGPRDLPRGRSLVALGRGV